MMKKLLCLFVAILFLFCGCVGDESGVEKITFSTWGSASEMSILSPIIDEFEKLNPNIKVDLMHIPQNYFQKIHLLFASNMAPDVVFINNLNLPVYADYLEPIHIENGDYYPQSIQALSYEGQLYAVPRDVSNLVIFYNKDIFDNCNIEYPGKDWSIDDLLETARKLTSKDVKGIGYEENMYYVLPYVLAFNESIYPEDAVQNLKSIKFYKDLVTAYKVAPSKSDVGSKTLAQLFLEEKIAMHLSGRWLVPKYQESAKFNWDVINFPSPVPCDASGWAISKNSKHKISALRLVEFLSSKENIEKMTQSGLIVPARYDVPFEDEVFKDVIKTSLPLAISKDYNKIIDRLNDTIWSSK